MDNDWRPALLADIPGERTWDAQDVVIAELVTEEGEVRPGEQRRLGVWLADLSLRQLQPALVDIENFSILKLNEIDRASRKPAPVFAATLT